MEDDRTLCTTLCYNIKRAEVAIRLAQVNSMYRFDVPKSKIKEVGKKVILSLDYSELFKYKVDKSDPLPTIETGNSRKFTKT
jgi:hypothetical protein